jgi:hypothetical protein
MALFFLTGLKIIDLSGGMKIMQSITRFSGICATGDMNSR